MRRALVTGGSGFVGANLVRRLLRDGHEVHLLLRREHDPWRLREVAGDVQMHEATLVDTDSVHAVVGAVRPEWVFHLAAYGAYPEQRDALRMVETNVVGTMNLLGACLDAGFEAFVNAGSSSEYGFKDHAPSEDERVDPNSDYAVTKVASTHHCRFVATSRDAHVVTLRLYSVYGPYEEPSRLMPTLVLRGLHRALPSLAAPDIARDYLYSDDTANAFVKAAVSTDAPRGAVYNVGTGIQTTLAQVVEVARRELGVFEEPVWGSMPLRSWDTNVWLADPTRIERELGWKAETPFAEGFAQLVSWFRDDDRRRIQYEERLHRGRST